MRVSDAIIATEPKPDPCVVGRVLAELNGDDRFDLERVLQPDSGFTSVRIADILAMMHEDGTVSHAPSDSVVGRHRSGCHLCRAAGVT